MKQSYLHSEVTSQFRDAMRAAGVPTSDHIIADGKLHRCNIGDDKRGKKNGWYILYIDEHPAGVFGCNKRLGQEPVKWSMKGTKRLSPDELRAMQEKAKADSERREKERAAKAAVAAARANAIWADAVECSEHPYLTRKGVKAYGLRTGTWIKDQGHDPETGEVNEIEVPNSLPIKVRNAANEIVSIQAIFPAKNEALGRDRDFLSGGEKRGCWYSFGKPSAVNDKTFVVICEGYATAASIYEATGIGCVVAFDAGNLKPVAETIRRLWPDIGIIIAADNDQWTKEPVDNPGLTSARAAAHAVGGSVAIPVFADVSDKPTDFNDLHARQGLAAVQALVLAAVATPAPAPEAAQAEAPPVQTEAEIKAAKKAERERKKAEKLAAAEAHQAMVASNPDFYDPERYFTVLGHDRTKIFVYSHEMKMIVSHPITGWNKHTMTQIARPAFWQKFNPNGNPLEPPPWDICENWLIEQAYSKGVYDPSISRGRGAWIDDGRIVYHFGNMLTVDGVEMPVTAIKSRYVYEQGYALPPPADEVLSDEEGRHILDIAKMFRWEKPSSAILLAGWVAMAPIAGALKWRPHIWITGGAGSGKTTILTDFVAILTAGTAVFAQGNSTEAGIRQKLRADCLPVLFDESEQQDEAAVFRIQNIIGLFRQASSESGAKTYKGTANGEGQDYNFRSPGCLASIGVNLKNDADRDRIAILTLKSRREGEGAGTWPAIKEALYGLARDGDMSARLMPRSIDLLPITLKNIDVFVAAGAAKFGSQREGDQYGTLMACAWSLVSSKVATAEQAKAMFDRYDWAEYVEHTEVDDSAKALSAILLTKVRCFPGDEITVHELIDGMHQQSFPNDRFQKATEALNRRGISVDHKVANYTRTHFFVGYCAADRMRDEMGQSYIPDFKGQIRRLKDAVRPENPVYVLGNRRGVLIPFSVIKQSVDVPDGAPDCYDENDDQPF